MLSNILWLDPGRGYSTAQRKALDQLCRLQGLNPALILHFALEHRIGKPILYQRTKLKKDFADGMRQAAEIELYNLVENVDPTVIVVNDLAALWLITDNLNYSLNLCRGSVYYYGPRSIPVIILDNLGHQYTLHHGKWVMANDLQKINRWFNGTMRSAVKFAYTVCRDIPTLVMFHRRLSSCIAMAIDIETRAGFITCISYTCLFNNGDLHTYVIPFLNSLRPGNCHWRTDIEEVHVWEIVRDIHVCEAYKIFQNGSYDCAYLIKYRVPVKKYFCDTLHLFHSIWAHAPKKLNFISSLFLDYMRYWKDEIKGDEEESFPISEAGLERYWRYNALDTYNTFYCAVGLLATILQPAMKWALTNYETEFSLQIGPCLHAIMSGLKLDRERQHYFYDSNMAEYEQSLSDLRTMVDDYDFNPNSPDQVAQLLYDILGAKPLQPHGNSSKANGLARSVDEKVLETIAYEQHPLFKSYIQKIWDTKKPLANASKYGRMATYNDRFMYNLSTAGTWTGRLSSKSHPFWLGTNAQNVPSEMRIMCVADEGYCFLEVDYSQSDAVFVAFECQDPNYISTMVSGKDTHSIHAAHFFKRSYEEVYLAAKNKEDWCIHPTKGIRQNTKRAVHGCNFQMTGYTLIVQSMKKEGAVGAMIALGFKQAAKLSLKELAKLVDKHLIESFHQLYKGLRPWFKQTAELCARNRNKVTCAFGKTVLFFGDPVADREIQRQISSFYGQGGTGGNINRSMIEIYYRRRAEFEALRCTIRLQVHDSLLFQLPIKHLDAAMPLIKEIMEQEFTIHGRPLRVKTDAKVGLSWGKAMIEYELGLTYAKLKSADDIAWKKTQMSV